MDTIKAGINGMGRIGQNLTRVISGAFADRIELVAVNDLFSAKELARALKRDSVYGTFPLEVAHSLEQGISIGGKEVKVYNEKDAGNIPWKKLGVEIVFECSGHYLTADKASAHIDAGAGKVVISAPPEDDTPIYVIGVNDDSLGADEAVISNASCSTNCYAPIIKAPDDEFGVSAGLMSTTHAVTNGQHVVDSIGNERARSALINIIPTGTGAARAVGRVLKHLDGKLNGSSLRVPVPSGSVVEAVTLIRGEHSIAEVIEGMKRRAIDINRRSPLGKVLYIGSDYEVSSDCLSSPWSSMVLESNAMAIPMDGNTLVKLSAFYDNEMGYSHRLAELGVLAASK